MPDLGSNVSYSACYRHVDANKYAVHRLTLPDLTPTTGLWWYFFTEMFDHFRPFFLMVFTVRCSLNVIHGIVLMPFQGPLVDICGAHFNKVPVRSFIK